MLTGGRELDGRGRSGDGSQGFLQRGGLNLTAGSAGGGEDGTEDADSEGGSADGASSGNCLATSGRVTQSSHNIHGHGEFGFLFGFGLAGLKKAAAHDHAGVS
nr:hypothetical protein [Nocardia tengchongensis]